MRIRWTPAAADLQRVNDYLKDHHPHYRQPTLRKVYAAIQSLKEWRIVAVSDARKEPESFRSRPCPISLSIA
jgi:hypothetical protein